jgi:hypothetical protein
VHRRDFVTALGSAVGLTQLACARNAAPVAGADTRQLHRIGLQLYSGSLRCFLWIVYAGTSFISRTSSSRKASETLTHPGRKYSVSMMRGPS